MTPDRASRFRFLPRTFRFALAVALLHWVLFAAFRIAFWRAFQATESAPASDLVRALVLGFKFDLRLALLVALPVLLFSWIPRLDPARTRGARRLWMIYLVGLATLFAFVYAVDFGHFDWTHGRIDATMLDHVRELGTALAVAWETYPIVWGVLGLAAFAVLFSLALRRFAFRTLERRAAPPFLPARIAGIAAFVAFYAWGINGTVGGYPLRWSNAFSISPNAFVSALGLNPVLYLADTWTSAFSMKAPGPEAARRHYDEVASLLHVDAPDRESLSFARSVRPEPKPGPPPNVVIVFLESFGANKAGVFGCGLDPTPNLDAIARDGTLFRSFYVASLPTGRSIFSVVTGIPDVNPGESASRNPMIVRQRTLANAFVGYEKLYFYTGNLNWANLRGVLTHNIADLRTFEYGDYSSPRNDGWGISDYHMFEEANRVFRTIRDRPFLAFLQTSGNHPPYTIADDRGEFRTIEVDEARLEANEFRSLDELNGLRFLDYSVGHFLEIARGEPYFENTVFLLFGDHAGRGNKTDPLEGIGFSSKHVPFVIYGPSRVPRGQVVDSVVSSVDVLPTALGLAGLPYTNHTFGRDMLAPRSDDERFALLREDGLVEPEFFYSAEYEGLFRYRSANPAEDVKARHPEVFARMKGRFTALYETARWLLHHNHD